MPIMSPRRLNVESPTRRRDSKVEMGSSAVGAKRLGEEHKAAMAQGRRESRIVAAYLEHLEARQELSGRRSVEDIAAKLKDVEAQLEHASTITRLALLQEREDLQREAMELPPEPDGQLEEQFIAVANSYGTRKRLSYSTWREAGVSKDVLEAAGIQRTRRPNKSKLKGA